MTSAVLKGATGAPRTAVPALRHQAPVRSYVLMLLAWMFDFQAESSGAGLVFQAAFASLYLMGFVLFLIGDNGRTLRIHGLGSFLVCTALFLITGLVSGMVREQTLYAVFRNGFSVLIYLSGAYATARIVAAAKPATLRRILGLACLGYAGANVLMTLLVQGGIDVTQVRYQIVGTSVFAALGYLALLLVFRLSRFEMAVLAFNFALVFLSVTRTYLLAVAVQLLPALRNMRRAFGPRTIVFLLVMTAILLAVLVFGEIGIERWSDRLQNRNSASGTNVTLLTRLSEWQFMWTAFLRSVDTVLFGNGFAAETVYWLPREIGGGHEGSIGYGHNQYLSILFIAGLTGGLPLIAVQILQAWRAFAFLSAAIRAGRSQSDLLFLGAWGATIVLGSATANILSANFGSRGGALWYAIGTGLLLGVQAWFDPVNRSPARARPRARQRTRHRQEH